jgi:hypothetical protein
MGMAMRGSIPKVMEMAGIEMLPPEAGVPWIRRELTAAGGSGEVLVALSLGALAKDLDESGGLDPERLARGPMVGGMARLRSDGAAIIETALDPAVQPFLRDHAIDGTPLLPGVMGIEAFAEAAGALSPGWVVDTIEDVDFLSPFKFYRGEPRVSTVETTFREETGTSVARCELKGTRQLANQRQTTTHFRGTVRLSRMGNAVESGSPIAAEGSLLEAASIYQVYFHGPAYRVLQRAWWTEAGAVGEMATDLPPNHLPPDQELVAEPRMIELCFQTAGLWEMAVRQRMGLPSHVDWIRVCRGAAAAAGPLYAVVTPNLAGASFDVEVVDSGGARYLRMHGYRTATLREEIDARLFAPASVAAV